MEGSSQEVKENEPVSDATQTAVIERGRATQVGRPRRLRLRSGRCGLLHWRLVTRRVRMRRTAGCREQQHQKVCHSESAEGREKLKEEREAPLVGATPHKGK